MTGIKPIALQKVSGSNIEPASDIVAIEEPLEIRLGWGDKVRDQKRIAVTMRTPGHDFELALGFLFSEGIINHFSEVEHVHYCADVDKEDERENVVRVELAKHVNPDLTSLDRNFYISSSCGVCGKSSIESVEVECTALTEASSIDRELVYMLPDMLRDHQHIFGVTGGLHASGLFDLHGNAQLLREDIGRHNALDKIIGARLIARQIPLSNHVMVLSGRAGFELVQKAIRAQVPILAAVGAPSSLSVELARKFNLTLIGFLKSDKFNIYAGEDRIK